MPAQERFKTGYKGVYYIEGKEIGTDRPEKIFYIMYRKNGKQIHEKAGRQKKDDMTALKASKIRVARMSDKGTSNKTRREEQRQIAWDINNLWQEYKAVKSIKGLVTDENRFQNYILPSFGKKMPSEISPLDVDRLRVNLLKKRTPQTVAHVLSLLRRIINFGLKKGLCDPVKLKIELPRVNNIVTEDLTEDQLKKLITVLNSYPDKQAANLIKLALYTGMRRGELFRLQWQDVDLENGFISISESKGGASQKIPLNDAAREVLLNHPKSESEFVFPGRFAGQRKSIQKESNKIKKLAGLPENFRPLHGYRHTFASMLASSGQVDMYTLQKLLTHKHPMMTQRYSHLRDETLKQASNLMGSLVADVVNGKGSKVIEIKK
jgi:integrase